MWLEWMHADVMAEIPPGERYAEAARGWLDGVLAEVLADLAEGLRARPVVRQLNRHFDTGPLGEPGQVLGQLSVGVTTPLPRRDVLYTEKAWQRMLGSLAKSPLTVMVSICPLGQDGYPSDQSAYFKVWRRQHEPGWVRFTFGVPARFSWSPRYAEAPRPGDAVVKVVRYPGGRDEPVIAEQDAGYVEMVPGPGGGWPGVPLVQDRWADFVKRQAARIGACAGAMTDHLPPDQDTVVQLPNWPPDTAVLGAGREVLGRFWWVTIVPPELAARLGGAAAMTASGAFSQASDLPDGSLWLRAAPTVNEFTRDRARQVAQALAPVLAGPRHRPVRADGRKAAQMDGERSAVAWDTGQLPAGLPAGRLVIPDPQYADGDPVTEPVLWVSDEPEPDAGRLWARLLGEHRGTGLWPLLLAAVQEPDLAAMFGEPDGGTAVTGAGGRPWQSGELAPVPVSSVDGVDAEQVLAAGWKAVSGDGVDFGEDAVPGLGFRSWPGLADPAARVADPDQHAAGLASAADSAGELTGSGDIPYLGLVRAPDGAAAIAVCGWLSPAGGTAETAAVVRSWQDRFGARLCSLGIDKMVLAVAWPPVTSEHARRVAAEHFAFCHELAGLTDFDEYAQTLIGASIWNFWWD